MPGAENLDILEVLGSSDEVLPLVAARMAAAAGVPLATPSVRVAVQSVVSSAAPAAGSEQIAAIAVIAPGPGEAAVPAAEGGVPRKAGAMPGAAAEAQGGSCPAGAREPQDAARERITLAAPGAAAAGTGAAELRTTVVASAAGAEATALGQCLEWGTKPRHSAAATAPATPTRPEPGVDVAEPQRVLLPTGACATASALGAGREASESQAAAAQGVTPLGPQPGPQLGAGRVDAAVGSAAGPNVLGAGTGAAACACAPDPNPAGAAGQAAALHGDGAGPLQAQETGRDPLNLPQGVEQAGAGFGRSHAVSGAPSGTLSLSVSGIELDALPEA